MTTAPEWSSELAYVIGLITTDGCLSSDGRHIIVTSQDIEVLYIVRRVLSSQNKIDITRNKHSQAFRIQIGNVTLYRWLESLGLHAAKSRTIGSVYIPDNFFIDFLRGHLDGDGSITTYTDKSNTVIHSLYVYKRLVVRFLSGSKKHMRWLHNKIIVLLNLKSSFHEISCKNHKPLYIIKFGKKESLKLLKLLYYSPFVPAMERKRIIANQFI